MSRLPQQVSALGRKLGVHPGPSPAKHSAVKPGSSVVRKPPQVSSVSSGKLGDEKLPRKSLHQVATETSAQKPTKTPTLVRFASDSAAVPGLKRERSQTPSLLSIPLAEGGSQGSARGSLAHFKRLSKREVDLSALSAANEAKLRKKASVQEQLKNAISALKKPNRVAAVKENVDFIERRSSGKGPQGVQIGATPKRTNKFSAVATPKQTSKSAAAMEFSALPRSSFIPSSAIRRGPDAEAVESAHRRNFGVQDTPSRGPGRMAAFLNRHMSHSVMNRGDDHSDVQKPDHAVMTPSRPRHKDVMEYNDGEEPEVFLTPLKRMAGPAILDDEMGGNEKTQRGSIYDALGWNDDVDDLA